MVAFEAFCSTAASAATTITLQDIGPQLAPASRTASPGRHNHVTAPDLLMTAPLNSTGVGRRARSPAAKSKAALASSRLRRASSFVTFTNPSLLITRFV